MAFAICQPALLKSMEARSAQWQPMMPGIEYEEKTKQSKLGSKKYPTLH